MEKPPDNKVVYLDDYKLKKAQKEAEKKRAPQRDYDPEKAKQYLRRVHLENMIKDEVGKDKWVELTKFANRISPISPDKDDREIAEQFRNMTDDELIAQLKVTHKEIWKDRPLAFKTLYEELVKRMKGENPEKSSE